MNVAFFSCPLNSASAFAPAAVSLPPPAAPLCTPCRARPVSLLAPEHLPLVVVAPGPLTVLMLSPVVQNAPHEEERQKMVPSSKINFLLF